MRLLKKAFVFCLNETAVEIIFNLKNTSNKKVWNLYKKMLAFLEGLGNKACTLKGMNFISARKSLKFSYLILFQFLHNILHFSFRQHLCEFS